MRKRQRQSDTHKRHLRKLGRRRTPYEQSLRLGNIDLHAIERRSGRKSFFLVRAVQR